MESKNAPCCPNLKFNIKLKFTGTPLVCAINLKQPILHYTLKTQTAENV